MFFSEQIKQAYTCPRAPLWTTGPTEDRFLRNISLFCLSVASLFLLACCPLLSFLRLPWNWLYLSSLIISRSFFPSLVRELSFIFLLPPSHPVEKVAKPALFVLLNQGLFPHKISLPLPPPFSCTPFFFLLVLPPKQGRSAPEAQHFNNSRCKVVFPV